MPGRGRLALPFLVDLDGRLSALKVGADLWRRSGDSLFGCAMFRWNGARRARLLGWTCAGILVDIVGYKRVLVLVVRLVEDYTSLCACRCDGRLCSSCISSCLLYVRAASSPYLLPPRSWCACPVPPLLPAAFFDCDGVSAAAVQSFVVAGQKVRNGVVPCVKVQGLE